MKGISRIDSRNTHAWFVRVYRDGVIHSKTFSDGVFGSKDKALAAAQEYKEDYERKHPPSAINARLRLKPPSNNKTGVVGVSETHDRSRSGKIIPCFSVSWRPSKNKTRCRKFYYHHYESREAAFEAAVKFRKEREEEIVNSLSDGHEPEHLQPEPQEIEINNPVKRRGRPRGKASPKPAAKRRAKPAAKTEISPLDMMLLNMKAKPFR